MKLKITDEMKKQIVGKMSSHPYSLYWQVISTLA